MRKNTRGHKLQSHKVISQYWRFCALVPFGEAAFRSPLLLCTVFVLLLLPQTVQAATYYVDAVKGNNSNPGTEAQPWATISKATPLLQAGDTLLIKAGTYRETVSLTKSGTATAPIKIMAYPGDEGKVIINAAEPLTGWTRCTSPADCQGNPNWQSIYYAPVNFSVTQLFQNGERLTCSRFPNQGWRYPTRTGAATELYDSGLTQPSGYFTGATTHVKTQLFWMFHSQVTGYSSSRMTLASNPETEFGGPSTDYGYFVTNIVAEINDAGEWAYNNNRVYLWPKAGLEGVEAAHKREYGLNISGASYCEVAGLAFKYANCGAIINGGSYNTLKDNVFEYNFIAGIADDGAQLSKIVHNEVKYSAAYGISVSGSSNTEIEENYVYATGAENFADDVLAGRGEGLFIFGNNIKLRKNTVDRTSYNGIHFASDGEVAYNYIKNAMLCFGDGGAIYTGGERDLSKYAYIHHDIFENMIGYVGGIKEFSPRCDVSKSLEECAGAAEVGIYMDERINNNTITDNTVINNPIQATASSVGIFIRHGANNTIENNTVFNVKGYLAYLEGRSETESQLKNCKFNGNILFAADPQQDTLLVYHAAPGGLSNISSDNNYFYNPYQPRNINHSFQMMTLSEWQNATGKDRNSREINSFYETHNPDNTGNKDAQIFINPSMDRISINLDRNYCDLDNNVVSESIILEPFTSKILLKSFGNNDGVCNNRETTQTCPADCGGSPIHYGDVSGDGEVSAYDAALTARIAVGLDPLGDKLQVADVSGDGEVSAYDAALIAQRAVGLITKFPVE